MDEYFFLTELCNIVGLKKQMVDRILEQMLLIKGVCAQDKGCVSPFVLCIVEVSHDPHSM